MADNVVPYFQNDAGSPQIEIGVAKFMCCGASAPFDHPHIFLDLASENEVICPYCSTLYKFSKNLQPNETKPENCLFEMPS